MSMEMLEDICDGNQSHLIANRIEARYKIHDHMKPIKTEWKGSLLSTQNMGKGLQKLFKAGIIDIL